MPSSRPSRNSRASDDIVAFYKKSFPEKLAALRALPAEKSTETLDFFGVMKMSRAQFIGFANNHSIHHRGQLAAYLRAMGSKVPNIYGPSADAEGSRSAGGLIALVFFPDLRAFLDQLRRDGDLVTVESQVDPRLEVAEIHRRVVAGGGPALLFTNVKGSDFRLVTNLFGTARRAEMAFGDRPLRLIRRLVELVETIMPPTPAKTLGCTRRRTRAAQGRYSPRDSRDPSRKS